MDSLEWVQQLCGQLPMVTEEFPFDQETMVWKVAGKMFCLGDISTFEAIGLKCDPDFAQELRAQYPQITHGAYLDKKHWNYVHFEGLPTELVQSLILHSYELVVGKLPKALKTEILSAMPIRSQIDIQKP